MPVKTFIESVRDTIAEEMARDDRVIVLGEDVGAKGGVFRATEGLWARYGDERVIDSPLAEDAIAGVAVGAAMNGLRPIAEIQFADFIYTAMDQIVNEAAKIRYRSNSDFSCPLVIRAPFGGGIHGALYHSQCVEGMFYRVPGLRVVAPSTPADAKGLLATAVRDDDPVLYFEHKRLYRRIKGDVPTGDYAIPFGASDVKRAGTNLTIVTYGAMVHLALEVADKLAVEGASIEVLDLRSLAPLDHAGIARSVVKTSKVLVLYEDNKTGGVGAEVAAFIAEELFEDLDGPIVRVAAPDVPAIPYSSVLEEAFLPNADKLTTAARRLLDY